MKEDMKFFVFVAIIVITTPLAISYIGDSLDRTTIIEENLVQAVVMDTIYWTDIQGGFLYFNTHLSSSYSFKWLEGDVLKQMVVESKDCTVTLTENTFKIVCEWHTIEVHMNKVNVYLPRNATLSLGGLS